MGKSLGPSGPTVHFECERTLFTLAMNAFIELGTVPGMQEMLKKY